MTAPRFRIVDTDNFGSDYPNEMFVGGVYSRRERAQRQADRLNRYGDWAPRYFKVVELPYKLQPGFEP